jgi:hypothetical protein
MSRHISVTDTAKLIRAALKAEFPSTKFSVRSKSYSMGASITVHWTDGPTVGRVRSVTDKFEGASFDGMIDLKSYVKREFEGEEVHFGADYVFTDRRVSDEHWRTVAGIVAKRFGVEAPASPSDATFMRVPHAGDEFFSTLVHRAMWDRESVCG